MAHLHQLACWTLHSLHKSVQPAMLVLPSQQAAESAVCPSAEGEDSGAWAGWDDVDTVQSTQSAKKKQDTDDWGKW